MSRKRIIFFENLKKDEVKNSEPKEASSEESHMREEENTSSEETNINSIRNVEELEVSQNVVRNVKHEETAPTRVLHDNISNKVVRFINDNNVPEIISLLGIDYDDRIREIKDALNHSQTINKEFCILSFIVDENVDVYDYLAAMMFNYLNKHNEWDIREKNQRAHWLNCLQKVKKETVNDCDELESLVIMSKNDDRPEAMKELIQIFLERMRIEKIVFIIDLHTKALNSKMLKMLRRIENKQCMFILGSMLDRDMQYDFLGEGERNRGRQIYYKYFGVTN